MRMMLGTTIGGAAASLNLGWPLRRPVGVSAILQDLPRPDRSADPVAALVAHAAGGDQMAFARIVAAHHEDLVRVCMVICRDADLANDAVQDAWSIAWRQLPRLREPERLRSWLVAIAANEARQILRRQRRRTVVEMKVPNVHPEEGTTVWGQNIDLRNALGRLSAEDRELLALRYVAGFDSSELSRVTGLSASGVRARLQRLLTVLRNELEQADA